jgi:hypothetical protein
MGRLVSSGPLSAFEGWRDVDFAGSAVRVRASYYAGHLTAPKSGKVRAVPLAPDVASALAQLGRREHWVGDDDLVFASVAGGDLDGSALRRRYKVALTSGATLTPGRRTVVHRRPRANSPEIPAALISRATRFLATRIPCSRRSSA